jgi:hypothetical protein
MRALNDHEYATVCKALFYAIKWLDTMPDQEQYRADRAAISRLIDDLDDAWLGERHRRPAG